MGKQARLKHPRRGAHRLEVGRDRAKPILVDDDGRPWAPPEWLADVEAEVDGARDAKTNAGVPGRSEK